MARLFESAWLLPNHWPLQREEGTSRANQSRYEGFSHRTLQWDPKQGHSQLCDFVLKFPNILASAVLRKRVLCDTVREETWYWLLSGSCRSICDNSQDRTETGSGKQPKQWACPIYLLGWNLCVDCGWWETVRCCYSWVCWRWWVLPRIQAVGGVSGWSIEIFLVETLLKKLKSF